MQPKGIAYYLLMGLFCLTIQFSSAQDQRVADSLVQIYQENNLEGIEQLKLLQELSYNELNDLNLSIKYATELIELSELANENSYLYNGYFIRGSAYSYAGELEKALIDLFKSVEIAIQRKGFTSEGTSYMSIAGVYNKLGNHDNSEKYYAKAIDIIRQTNDSITLGSTLLNAGDAAFNNKKYEKAMLYFEETARIFKNLKYTIGIAYNNGNMGMVYAEQGMDVLAELKINEAVTILEEIKDYYPISVYLTYMSDIYLRKNDYPKALNYAQRSLDLAKKYGLKEQIRDANLKLSELYQESGDYKNSIGYLNNYYTYRDSVINIKAIEQIADLRTNFEVSQKQIEVDLKQTEVDLLDQQKRNQQLISLVAGIGIVLILIIAIGLYRRNNFIAKAKLLVENEKKRSDKLLLNILPEETAKELKENGKVKAKKFESVSVLFTDFKGFTEYSANLSPEELVESVNFYYSKFDEIMEKYGLEKIKTVGDAYMAAGGLPFPSDDHAIKLAQAAFEIADFVKAAKMSDPDNMTRFDIRIGINTGPVVAGVVGTKKFAYDIWGDTVNIASRMESNSKPGKINASEATYQLIKHKFSCTYRGEIETKNKGLLKMYFVDSMKEGIEA